ncbi:hypothetical protein GCM10022236_13110 [Microlunatus ginsengisoli]|uniref:Uncharacterized protein n=1 Tax=Microlunatus ginsengisoli TaxID=363863 RepID=A0ABP6ZKZ0_9ACTN
MTLLTVTLAALFFGPTTAQAASPTPGTGTNTKDAVRSLESVGYDISWPQCGKTLPTGQAFAVVGVNGGTAANTNPCLSSQLKWGSASVGGSSQPKLHLYVNTANPGEVISQITTWPTNNNDSTGFTTANPYGSCGGGNDLPCSWQYGWNRAVQDHVDRFAPAARAAAVSDRASDYVWWLDVETSNTWQSGSAAALQRNAAALEGMTAYFTSTHGAVGLYSTAAQWSSIVGTVDPASNLNDRPNWRPSGSTVANAKTNCSLAPLTTGGFISLTQYVQHGWDKNYSCM